MDKKTVAEVTRQLGKIAVSPVEAMDLTGVGRNTIYAELASGRLRGKRIGKKWVIPVSELVRWLETDEAGVDR